MTQNIYTELVFKQPTEIFNILDQIQKFEDQHHYVELYANFSPYVFQIPLEVNKEHLSKLFLIDQYIDAHFDEKDKREVINGVESIDLGAFFNFLDNHFQMTVKCDRDDDFIIYCDEEDWTYIFQKSNNLNSEYQRLASVQETIKFKGEKNLFQVRAKSSRYAVCTRQIDRKSDKNLIIGLTEEEINTLPVYALVDFEEKIRAPHNLLFNSYDFGKDEDCIKCLQDLESGAIELSRRNKVNLIIENK